MVKEHMINAVELILGVWNIKLLLSTDQNKNIPKCWMTSASIQIFVKA